jgi:hypothetical protein
MRDVNSAHHCYLCGRGFPTLSAFGEHVSKDHFPSLPLPQAIFRMACPSPEIGGCGNFGLAPPRSSSMRGDF